MTLKYPHFRFLSLLLLFSLMLVGQSLAASTGNLYESSIKVADNKTEKELIAESFAHVLIKVTGHSDITASPAYPSLLAKAQDAISQFRYDYKFPETVDSATADEGSESKKSVQEKWFWVRFNPGIIDTMIKQAQLPVWGKVRPDTLIWFAQEMNGKRILQSQYEQPEVYQIFKQRALYRGIPLTFPFLDLQDQNNISAADIWGNFNDAILLASRRYQSQVALTIRLEQGKNGIWSSQWNLLMLGQVQSWRLQDKDKQHLLAAGIDELADRLARQFAQTGSRNDDGANNVLVQINNVTNFREFQELDDYLRNLATIKSLDLMQTQQDKVFYKITYRTDKKALIQEIRLGDLLNSVERSRVDYTNNDEAREFKPVILEGAHQTGYSQPGSSAVSEREKALNAINRHKGQTAGSQPDSDTQHSPDISTKIDRQLVPELEYWLAR